MADAKTVRDGGTDAAPVVNGETCGVTGVKAKGKVLVRCPGLAGKKARQRRRKVKSAVRARKEYGTHETYGRKRGKVPEADAVATGLLETWTGRKCAETTVRKSNRRCEIRKDANAAETTEKEGVVCSKFLKGAKDTDGGRTVYAESIAKGYNRRRKLTKRVKTMKVADSMGAAWLKVVKLPLHFVRERRRQGTRNQRQRSGTDSAVRRGTLEAADSSERKYRVVECR
ncbi:hypothetical protein R3P38DRAFT_2781667 [Favolaschia claudopus]|uniref:Uncharacterized protein n=1 Tax=Favolaschia claudopus TaxID=2862362 RepID=A0AAW0B4L6_9AGAR